MEVPFRVLKPNRVVPVTEQGHTVLQMYNNQMSYAGESERSHTAVFTLFTTESIFLRLKCLLVPEFHSIIMNLDVVGDFMCQVPFISNIL